MTCLILAGTLVHQGFLRAYNAVAADILDAVSSQLAQHPGYTLSTSGHSLGGALSAIAGVSLKQNFPNVYVPSSSSMPSVLMHLVRPLKMFTYGMALHRIRRWRKSGLILNSR